MYQAVVRSLIIALKVIRILFQSKADLITENLALHQQLAAYKAKKIKPKLSDMDRSFPDQPDGQALPAELIHHSQHAKRTAIRSALKDDIVTPNMIPFHGAKPHAGPIIEPQATPFGLLRRHLQTFLPPDPLNTLVIYLTTSVCLFRAGDSFKTATQMTA